MDKNVEMEMKLTVTKENLKKILESALIKNSIMPAGKQEKELESSYYDSQDFRLLQAGLAYRVRKSDVGFVATVKTEGSSRSGFTERQEFNVNVTGPTPTLEGFAEQGLDIDLRQLLDGAPLKLLFKVSLIRRILILQITPATMLEMAIDEGSAVVGRKKEKIEEIEFEIVHGNKADLFNFIADLAKEAPLFIEPRSKFKRGLDLLRNQAASSEIEDNGVDIDREGNVEAEFKKLIYYDIGVVLEALNALLEDTGLADADRILLNRVKRLRSIINFIHPLIQEDDFRCFHDYLIDIVTPLQELYVLKRFMRQWAKVYKKTGTVLRNNVLSTRLEERKAEIMASIKAQVDGGLYAQGMFKMLAWAENSHWREAENMKLDEFSVKRFKDWHKKLLAYEFKNEMLEEETAREMRKIIEVMVMVRRSIKIGTLDKQTFAYMKDLYRRLKILNFDIYGHKDILAFLQGTSSRVLYRDAGLLIGWRLAEMPTAWRKVQKSWSRLLDVLKSRSK
ncbi:MAG: CYTH domain-containing protein [Acidaminococcaceae bacterium]|nr:CYTH domain-containing protein [Acidaminococcaceae bacterium]